LSGGRSKASLNFDFGLASGGTATYSKPAAFMQAAVASSIWRCLASCSSLDSGPPTARVIRTMPPLLLLKPSPMYSASGLLSSLSTGFSSAPGELTAPQPARARTAISDSALREFFMAASLAGRR
jgi:hypothetical protein